MHIKGIDHFVITVQNLEKTLDFYVNKLGMLLDTSCNRIALKFGHQKINVHRCKAEFFPSARCVTSGSMDVCFIADGNINTIKEELLDKGLTIEVGVVSRKGANGSIKSIYLRDPDGNLVEIATYN